jgi:quinol monooxygenase YgiN
MQVWFVHCRVKPGKAEAFLAATLENARASNKEAGIARFDLLRDAADSDRFVLVEAYSDPGAPALHKASPHYAAWAAAVEELLAEPRTKQSFEGIFVP